jgi:hypothetical protein
VNVKPDRPTRRIALAFVISLLLHGLIMWGPRIKLPNFKPSLPPLTAKLEALPSAAPTKPKPKRKAEPAVPKVAPDPEIQAKAATQSEPAPQDVQSAASEVVAATEPDAASSVAESGSLAAQASKVAERPPLPRHAQLTFDIHWSGMRVGESIHTLEIDDGKYQLHAVTKTVGLARVFKSYELTWYSSGSYTNNGLVPEQFLEERKESSGTQHNTVNFDHAAQLARFSNGRETALPPDTQDFLSNMYQFPPLQGVEIAAVSVSNSRKIEQYEFEIAANEEIDTSLGKLLAVRLRKLHSANEEGLEIWLAREYRLFPVKIRQLEKNGEVSFEAVITDIRVSEEEGVRKDVAN